MEIHDKPAEQGKREIEIRGRPSSFSGICSQLPENRFSRRAELVADVADCVALVASRMCSSIVSETVFFDDVSDEVREAAEKVRRCGSHSTFWSAGRHGRSARCQGTRSCARRAPFARGDRRCGADALPVGRATPGGSSTDACLRRTRPDARSVAGLSKESSRWPWRCR